jgi:hypothetical protein
MKLKNIAVILLLLAFLAVHPGCYGSFGLTKSLHDWNGNMESDWAGEGVFLLFVIVPVYGVTMVVDAVIFNSIEFWSGDNPIKGTSMIVLDSDRVAGQVAELSRLPDGTVLVRAAGSGQEKWR